MNKKIGILGGTFNPIHIGHLTLAWQAYDELKLNKILFMPSKNPPHKDKKNIIDDNIRCKLIELAISDNTEIFELSKFELLRDGTTYTSETLELLKKNHVNTDIYFIMGADSLLAIENWHEPQKIFKLANIVVAVRDDVNTEKLASYSKFLEDKYNGHISILKMPRIDISSRNIRNNLKEKADCNPYFIPKSVYDFLINNKIYQC